MSDTNKLMREAYEKWAFTPYSGPLWNFKEATWNAWQAAIAWHDQQHIGWGKQMSRYGDILRDEAEDYERKGFMNSAKSLRSLADKCDADPSFAESCERQRNEAAAMLQKPN